MSRICAIHQPNFFPWLGYFHKIARADVFVILDTVDIEVGTADAITNRTRIKTASGVQWITIPIKKGDSKIIKDIAIDNSKPWNDKMLKTIFHQYRKSAYFSQFYPFVEQILKCETDSLSNYNTNVIKKMAGYFGLSSQIVMASAIDGVSTERNQRLIDICKSQNCDVYLSGNGGRKYHDEQLFAQSGVKVEYTDFVHPIYPQLYGDFVKGVSAMDYCFNVGDKLWK